jgi:hypothetical protein
MKFGTVFRVSSGTVTVSFHCSLVSHRIYLIEKLLTALQSLGIASDVDLLFLDCPLNIWRRLPSSLDIPLCDFG